MRQAPDPITLDLPANVARWVAPRSWLDVRRATRPRLHGGRNDVALDLVPISTGLDDDGVLATLSKTPRSDGVRVATARYLRQSLRDALERRGIAYIDARGHIHIPWPDGLLHVEPAADSVGERAVPHLGVHGVRAVQAILDDPSTILVSQLAATARLSLSRTHSILKVLESAGLLRTTGTGPTTRRHVIDRGELLDWLATQPAARRRDAQLQVALYARTPEDVWRLVRQRLDRAKIAHALSGSAAAAVLRAGPTAVIASAVRIDPDVPLEHAARALGTEKTDRGANLRLVRDTGLVGTLLTSEHDGHRLAPRPRIYLDTLGERRGDDIAQHVREVVLGY